MQFVSHVLSDVPEKRYSPRRNDLPAFWEDDLIKIFAMGWSFCRHRIEIFDAIIIASSFAIDLIFLGGVAGEEGQKAAAVLVILLLWRIARVVDGIVVTMKQRQEFRIRLQKRARRTAERKLESYESEKQSKNGNHDFITVHCIRCFHAVAKYDVKVTSLKLQKQIDALKELCAKAGIPDSDILACTPKHPCHVTTTLDALSSVAKLSVSMTMLMSSSSGGLSVGNACPHHHRSSSRMPLTHDETSFTLLENQLLDYPQNQQCPQQKCNTLQPIQQPLLLPLQQQQQQQQPQPQQNAREREASHKLPSNESSQYIDSFSSSYPSLAPPASKRHSLFKCKKKNDNKNNNSDKSNNGKTSATTNNNSKKKSKLKESGTFNNLFLRKQKRPTFETIAEKNFFVSFENKNGSDIDENDEDDDDDDDADDCYPKFKRRTNISIEEIEDDDDDDDDGQVIDVAAAADDDVEADIHCEHDVDFNNRNNFNKLESVNLTCNEEKFRTNNFRNKKIFSSSNNANNNHIVVDVVVHHPQHPHQHPQQQNIQLPVPQLNANQQQNAKLQRQQKLEAEQSGEKDSVKNEQKEQQLQQQQQQQQQQQLCNISSHEVQQESNNIAAYDQVDSMLNLGFDIGNPLDDFNELINIADKNANNNHTNANNTNNNANISTTLANQHFPTEAISNINNNNSNNISNISNVHIKFDINSYLASSTHNSNISSNISQYIRNNCIAVNWSNSIINNNNNNNINKANNNNNTNRINNKANNISNNITLINNKANNINNSVNLICEADDDRHNSR
ncbi:hypothetical protein HELRODRAFT_161501 [Helobdella robusta]|uniref:Voltage-gated hydrogen channel 1 n=1 Tax=Helobdella robusta TaxID=6412 RepID=T1ERK2_HELRO|nr:hypothetical protein HELRODRAFT_161501 [Helobdella robusta]ESO02255.1 hypothetical protein HELRODRAFT_161501 [Helobdella robusta]